MATICAEMEESLPRYGYEVSWLPTFLRRARELGATPAQLSEIRNTWNANDRQVRYSDPDYITPEEVASSRRTCTLNGNNIPR